MPYIDVIWDLPDDPEGNVQHIAEHGLTPSDVESVLNDPDRSETSRSSGRAMVFGYTPSGEYIAVVYEEIFDGRVYLITAYESREVTTMSKHKYRGVSRSKPQSSTEAAKYRKIRKQVEAEFPPVVPDPVKVAIAKLRAMRDAKGVSLSDLAARTGMTRGNIARLESQKNATLRTLQRYADGLDCELEINVIAVDVRNKAKQSAAN